MRTVSPPSVTPALDRPQPSPPRRGLPVAAAALVAGLALGYLAGAYATPAVPRAALSPTTTTTPGRPAALPATETTLLQQTLAEELPGAAGLRLLMVNAADEMELLVWPAEARHPQRTELPFQAAFTEILFDNSGTWMSALTDSVFERALYVGNVQSHPSPVFLDVTSSRWDPTVGARIAWTARPTEGETFLLYRGPVVPNGVEAQPLIEVAENERLLAWGSFGYLLGTEEDCPALRTIDGEGRPLGEGRARFIDATTDGRLLLAECGQEGLSPVTLTDARFQASRVLEWAPADAFAAHWSPGGRRIAFFAEAGGPAQLEVFDVDGRRELSVPVPRPISVDWTLTDFLVIAARGGQVVTIDLQTGSDATLDLEGRTLAAALR
ncbi:MAG: hypothetical protein ACRD02_05980 [Acidimicrobiia bacterium]